MEDKILVGDIVRALDSRHHATEHKWDSFEHSLIIEGSIYTVEDVDYNTKYMSGYVIKIGNRAYGSVGVEVISSILDKAREIINKD